MAAITITPASVLPVSSNDIGVGIAGETLTAGELLYKDAADSNSLKLADADAAGTAAAVGVCAHAATDGQPTRYYKGGTIAIGATVVAGTHYFAHTTAGSIGPFGDLGTGDYLTPIGMAVSTANIKLAFDATGVVKA